MGNDNGIARLLTSPLLTLKKVNTSTETSDFYANLTAHIWIHTVGGVCIKRPLVQVCKRTLQSAAPSRVFRIPGLACASKWTDYGIRWLVS